MHEMSVELICAVVFFSILFGFEFLFLHVAFVDFYEMFVP